VETAGFLLRADGAAPSPRPPQFRRSSDPPNPSPRPPPKFQYPFETLSVEHEEPTVAKATVYEDLGRILPSEEPDVMMQMSILPPPPPPPLIKVPEFGCAAQRHPRPESPYMEMANGTEYVNLPTETEPSVNQFGSEDDDYLTVDQLHMPSGNVHIRLKTELKKKLSPVNGCHDKPCLDKTISTSITQLLMNTETGAEAFWHSAPSLEKPPPIAARRQTGRAVSSSSPSALPRLIPPRILPRNTHRNV